MHARLRPNIDLDDRTSSKVAKLLFNAVSLDCSYPEPRSSSTLRRNSVALKVRNGLATGIRMSLSSAIIEMPDARATDVL